MAAKRECVKVIVRCRPLSAKEIAAGHLQVIDVDRKRRSVEIRAEKGFVGEKEFTYDGAYGIESTQEEVYDESVKPLVDAVLEGFNGTIFAYGQTGTGKTFTMQGTKSDPGIIPRAMEGIFRHIDLSKNEHYLVNASYLEIYQEEVRDLLRSKDKEDQEKKIEIKEKPNGEIYLKHLSLYQLKSLRHMEKMMERGQSNRSVGATDMNEHSSRSHAIFIVNIECGQIGQDGKEHIRVGKLNLVDLAGSERQSKTNSTGDRFKEATQINLSLSALGNVINALVEKASHVPYRDSKLTRLLQDSLGGNSKTIMVANVGPANYNLEETISTLRYASRAKNIKNNPHINEDPKDAKMREYLDELSALKEKRAARSNADKRPRRTPRPQNAADESDDTDSEDFAKERDVIAQERSRIMEDVSLKEKEKDALLRDFTTKEENLRNREDEQRDLKAKVEAIEQRMLRGNTTGNVQEKVTLQRDTLQKTQKELDEQKMREEAILKELDQEHRQAQEVTGNTSVVQEDIDKIQAKINKLQRRVDNLKIDLGAEESVAQKLNESVGDQLEDLRQKESLMWTIITSFISPAIWEPAIEKATYDEQSADWTLASEISEMSRPPIFLGIPASRQDEIREQYPSLLPDNVLELELDVGEDHQVYRKSHEPESEDAAAADLLAEALDLGCSEEDIIIDADIFTIVRLKSRANDPFDLPKENIVRRIASASKPLRSSPDLTFPSARGLLK